MYKVFVNDKPIILTDSLKKENNFPNHVFKNVVVDEIIYKLYNGNKKGVNIYCEHLERDWQLFLKNFKVITAAGGLVLNSKNEILFIYRGNKWDLPKGRIEDGETIDQTAIREVEEECGITNLKINHFLITTYHFFYQNNEKRIKETFWYLMKSDFDGILIPQLEEGITKAIFKNQKEVALALKNTYSNIQLVYNQYEKGN